MKTNHKPLSMRCTRDQFEEIRPILEANGKIIEDIDGYSFSTHPYLTNNYGFEKCRISNILDMTKNTKGRKIYEEWNAEIFLDACGITTEKERGISITHVKDMLEPENKYDVASRVVAIFNRLQNGKLTTSSAGDLIASEIEAYAEMKVQQAKGGNNE